MYKIGVIGDKDSVLGFQALGLDVLTAETPQEAETHLQRAAGEEYAIVFLTERLAAALPETLERLAQRPLPAVILIPDHGGSLGIGMEQVGKCVERAVGADIIP